MISLSIKNTKQFMSHLLVQDTFDNFFLSEVQIKTANSFTIDGRINKSFYTREELENNNIEDFSRWTAIRPVCFNLVKGNKVPAFMKIVFMLPDDKIESLFNESSPSFSIDDINGLYLNIRYSDGRLNVITGISINAFTMDKSLEHALDKFIEAFMINIGIDFEIM